DTDMFHGVNEADVTLANYDALCGSAGHQIGDHCGARGGQSEPSRQPRIERHGLRSDAEPATPHPSVPHDAGGDIGCRVDADGKADALRGVDHRGVDADNAAIAVNQWAARIARVKWRVGLDDAVDQPPRRATQAAAERADDAGRHGRLKTQRIADRYDNLADAQPGRAAEFGKGQPAR